MTAPQQTCVTKMVGMMVGISFLSFLSSAPCLAQHRMQDDLKHRNPAITWPSDYDPQTALLFSHNELLVPTSCVIAFQQLVRAESWPAWLVFAKDVQTPGHAQLSKGMTFAWSIFERPIRSTVQVYEPSRQIGWLNEASRYYQAWIFEPKSGACRITTEEIGVGEPARHAAEIGDDRTHRAHDLWLASLRWVAEGGTNLH